MKTKDLTKIALCVALLCISSYIIIPLPFSLASITAQTIVINLIGLIMLPKEAFVTEHLDVKLEKNISFWNKISKEEVYKFSKLIGDENYIHLTNKPVVQGMFLLNEIIKEICNFKELEIKFTKPIFADEEIFLQKGEESILAYSNNKLCFKIIFK